MGIRTHALPEDSWGATAEAADAPAYARPARRRAWAMRRYAAFPRISVIIPARNEARNLSHVLARIPTSVSEVVLVDGDSSDDTVAVARALRPDIVVVRQEKRGKGDAIRCGLAATSGDIVVLLDADGSTDPQEIDQF